MPIPRGQFDQGTPIETLGHQVLAFLDKNRERAYTAMEIYEAVFHPPVIAHGADYNLVWIALESLIHNWAVLGRVIEATNGKETYFALR